MIKDKIKDLEKELAKIDWSKEEKKFNDLSKEASDYLNAMLKKQDEAKKLKEAIELLEKADEIMEG